MAVKKVSSNRGKKTPDIDDEIWNSDEKKWIAIKSLKLVG